MLDKLFKIECELYKIQFEFYEIRQIKLARKIKDVREEIWGIIKLEFKKK